MLTPQEADHLFRILRNLRGQGKTVILITHKLREIMAVTDNVTRDARTARWWRTVGPPRPAARSWPS